MSHTAPAVPEVNAGLISNSLDGKAAVTSQEEVPNQDRTSEVVSRTGSNSDLESFIRTHFVTVASLVWSVSQLAGELLWTTPIHPNYVNEIISHLYQLFNTWTGGFDYKVKIAGTGFHAGAIILYRLPPNIDPSKVKTISQITHFPYEIIEAKQLEMVTIEFFDQLNTWFHYTSPPFDAQDRSSFGGHVCIAVWSPLVATGSGAQQINVIVSTKASPSFCFNQIIPPSIRDTIDTGRDLSSIKLFFPLRPFTRLFNILFENLMIHSSSVVVALNNFTQGCYSFARTPMSDIAKFTVREEMWCFSGTDNVAHPYSQINKSDRDTMVFPYTAGTDTTISFDSATRATSGAPAANPVDPSDPAWMGPSQFGFINPFSSTAAFTTAVTQTAPLVPPIPESFVTFRAKVPHVGSVLMFDRCQTEEMSDILQFGNFPNIQPNQAIMVLVSDKILSLPLFYIKIHHKGYVTTNATTSTVIYDYTELDFTPTQVTQASDPLPAANYANVMMSRLKRFQI